MKLKKIMVVDDDPEVLMLVDMVLSKIGGFEVTSCDSGLKALEQMDDFDPDLVVIDVMMPRMDGTECLNRMRKSGRRTPVIFLTAKGRRAQTELQLFDCIAVLSKPFDPLTLVEQIQTAWVASQTSFEDSA